MNVSLKSQPGASTVQTAIRDQCNVCGRSFDAKTCERIRLRCNSREFSTEHFHVWRCAGCRCLHCWEVVDLDHYYANYGTKYQRLDIFFRLAYRQQLSRLRAAGFDCSHRLLDYGCGSGIFVQYLRERGYLGAVGYDPYGDASMFGDASTPQSDSFDFITLQDVIEHVEDPRALLRKLAGLLKPGGVLLVGAPSADEISLGQAHRHRHHLHVPYHLHIYTRQALVDLGRDVGLAAARFYRRFYIETPFFFGMNEVFLRAYLERLDDNVESLAGPPRIGLILRSPALLFHGTFGYFYSFRHCVTVIFRKS